MEVIFLLEKFEICWLFIMFFMFWLSVDFWETWGWGFIERWAERGESLGIVMVEGDITERVGMSRVTIFKHRTHASILII